MSADIADRLRALPKIDVVLARPEVAGMDGPRWAIRQAVRDEVEALRARIVAGESVAHDADGKVSIELAALEHRVRASLAPSLREVINATGVVLHTNLGRAPLGRRVIERLASMAGGYSNIEYDIDSASRGSRHAHLAKLLLELTGADDAVVVNNNAGAVMLALAALAAGREVVVSRGELIEIGGAFRIPDVMRLAGASLVEVGTTNKTRIDDYRAGITEHTAVLLKVHPSNFAIVGFTHETTLEEIVRLGHVYGVPTMMDLGSGSLVSEDQMVALGLLSEPSVRRVMASGVDLVTFSGDKLLGGPQAGIICGGAKYVAPVRKHPMMRALRPDKLALAALEATLSLYRDGLAMEEIPVWMMLSESQHAVRARAEHVVERLARARGAGGETSGLELSIALTPCESRVGGGTMPLARLPSYGLCLRAVGLSARQLRRALHDLPVPIIGRIVDERVLLDIRTVREEETDLLVHGLATLAGRADGDDSPGS